MSKKKKKKYAAAALHVFFFFFLSKHLRRWMFHLETRKKTPNSLGTRLLADGGVPLTC